MSNLPTNYVDDVLNADVNTRRKYQMIQNGDGTVSLVDVTDYDTVGSSIGAAQINAQNTQINQNTEDISSLNQHLTDKADKSELANVLPKPDTTRTASISSNVAISQDMWIYYSGSGDGNSTSASIYQNNSLIASSTASYQSTINGSFYASKGDVIRWTRCSITARPIL